jgi:hypothetical protein
MIRRVSVLAALAFALVLAACGQDYDPAKAPKADIPPASAQSSATPDSVPATPWAALAGHIGKYPNETGLFDTSVIAPDLKALLGEKFVAFKTNMQTEGPLAKDQSGVLWTSGARDGARAGEQAYLIIDPAKKQLEVGLWEQGKLSTYATPGSALPRPQVIQTMIAKTGG